MLVLADRVNDWLDRKTLYPWIGETFLGHVIFPRMHYSFLFVLPCTTVCVSWFGVLLTAAVMCRDTGCSGSDHCLEMMVLLVRVTAVLCRENAFRVWIIYWPYFDTRTCVKESYLGSRKILQAFQMAEVEAIDSFLDFGNWLIINSLRVLIEGSMAITRISDCYFFFTVLIMGVLYLMNILVCGRR